jgi:hypothetical protein
MQEVVLRPLFELRLGDFAEWHRIAVRCYACEHTAYIDPARLRARLSKHTRIIDIEGRFKCRVCGNRLHNSWKVVQLAR